MSISKSSENKFHKLKNTPEKVLCVHCSRQSLRDNEGGRGTPRITAIIIKSLDGRIQKTFAIHHEAEKVKVIWEEIENYYDQLEERMINSFNRFVSDYIECKWLHWNMDGVHQGFEAIEHRYCVLVNEDGKGLNKVPVEKRISLQKFLEEKYGQSFESEPKLQNLMKSNTDGVIKAGFLSLDEEARAFKELNFPKILESVRCKVDFLIEVFNRTVNNKLNVSNKNTLHKIETFITHPVVALMTAFCTVAGLVVAIYSLF